MAAKVTAPAAGPHFIGHRWRAVILAIPLVLALACGVALGGEAIDIVLSTDDAPYRKAAAAAAEALEERGYTTRRVRLAELEDTPLEPDAVSAWMGVGSAAARHLHTHGAPEVLTTYCMVSEPEEHGLTEGRPAYGVSVRVSVAAQFELIERTLPQVRAVGMIYRAADGGDRWRRRAEAALPSHWVLHHVALEDHDSASEAIAALMRHDVDVVWTMPDRSVYDAATVRALLLAMLRQRTPVFGFSPAFVRAGALLGVGMTPQSQGRRAAELTWQHLESDATAEDGPGAGGGDAELTPSQPRVYDPPFQIAVNPMVGERLGITLPDDLVREADYVFTSEHQ